MFFSFCVRCRRARATLTRRRLCGCAVCALVVVAGGAAQGLLCRYYRSMRGATSTTRFHSFGGGCCCFCFIPGNGRNLCDIYDVWKSCKVHKNEEKLNFSSAVVVFFCFGLIICRTTLLSERQRALASLFEHFRQRRQWAPVWMSHWRAIVYSTTRIRARANEYINKWLFFSLAFFRFAPCLLSHRCFSIFVGALWARTRSMKWKEQTHLMNERLVRLGAHARLESGYKESGTFNNAFYEYARVTRKHDSAFNEQSERCASQYCAKAGQSHVDGKAAK